MKKLAAASVLLSLLLAQGTTVFGSGTSTPPPVSGASNSQAFQLESATARVVSVDQEKGIVVLREEKKKNAREFSLSVNPKTSLKAGKEKIQLGQLEVGSLVKAVFDRSMVAVSIKVEKEKA